jgi:hypothetical protein
MHQRGSNSAADQQAHGVSFGHANIRCCKAAAMEATSQNKHTKARKEREL